MYYMFILWQTSWMWGIIMPTMLAIYPKPWVLSFPSCLELVNVFSTWINLLATKPILVFVFSTVIFIQLISGLCNWLPIICYKFNFEVQSFLKKHLHSLLKFLSLLWAVYALKAANANEIMEDINLFCLCSALLFTALDPVIGLWGIYLIFLLVEILSKGWQFLNDCVIVVVLNIWVLNGLLLLSSVQSLFLLCWSLLYLLFCIKVLFSQSGYWKWPNCIKGSAADKLCSKYLQFLKS